MAARLSTVPVTLAELLRIDPLAAAAAAVLPDPTQRVEGVVLAETVDRLRRAAPHSLVVLHAEAATGGWSLAAAMHLAWERHVAGIVVARAVASESGVSLAQRLGMALLLIDGDPVDVALRLAGQVSAPAAARAQRQAECAGLLAEQHSVRGIVGVLNHELARVPVALVVDGTVMAGRAAAVVERPDVELVRVDVGGSGERPWAQLVAAVPAGLPGAAEGATALLRLARPSLTAVWAQSRLDVSAHAATEQAAFAMLRRIASEPPAAEPGDRPAVDVPAWSSELGWQVDGVNRAVWIAPLQQPTGAPPDELTHLVRTAWRRGRVNRPLVSEGEGWISWVSGGEDDVTGLRRALTAFHESALAHRLVVGVGAGHEGVAGLMRSVAEARLSAHVAREGGAGSVQWFDQVGAPAALAYLPLGDIAGVAELCLDDLVQARDRLGLVTTVLAVLDCGGSLSQASQRLGVHRNTVLARLTRARQLGLAYDDASQRLAMHVLCHALAAQWSTGQGSTGQGSAGQGSAGAGASPGTQAEPPEPPASVAQDASTP